MESYVKREVKVMIDDSIESKRHLYNLLDEIEKASEFIIDSLKKGNKILICGNGGSASQSQHFAAELIGRFEKERNSIPGISLTTDTSNLTAIGNDYGFKFVFKRQIESLGKENDILICLTTSGNSENLIEAIKEAKLKNMKIINLLGRDGGKMKDQGDINIIIPSQNSARIQESHLLLLHIFAKLIENSLSK